jgi:hypothetical protein
VNRYVAAGPSLAVFLLAAQVAQQCLVTPEKSAQSQSALISPWVAHFRTVRNERLRV